uniref:OCIA domain-containing protein 1 n=1 Tax=Ciona intestinalis TaxID=7719 RepID=UPI000180C7C9|nr:OCIA domain-containing protein 1 [Ciona intestinalis]|eukprot:XP_002126440.1 OCIA domain-containing protein 1 [Ciona intestinalis]
MNRDMNMNTGASSSDSVRPPNILSELTSEEKIVLKRLKNEAFMYRGLPTAFVAMSVTQLWLSRRFPNLSTVRRVGLCLFSGVMGNFAGQVSYVPRLKKRLERDLPEDSNLRKLIFSNNDKMASAITTPDSGFTMAETDKPQVNYNEDETNVPSKLPTYNSYEEMRKTHRSSGVTNTQSNNTSQWPSLPQNTNQTNQGEKIKYNKYGDPIQD